MKLDHVLESQQFTVPLLLELFDRTRRMERIVKRGGTKDYEKKIMASLFYRPSTRTRFSFEAAMLRLGGGVISTEQAKQFSSEFQSEQLEDTIRTISTYCDVIVLRYYEDGGSKRAAQVSSVPIINAGEGAGGQHPSQALLDLYTIATECKTLHGLSVALIGALDRGRTARSLAYLLSKFERVKLYFIAPPEMQIGEDILTYLDQHHVSYELDSTPATILPYVNVVYQTRIDRERLQKKDMDLA
jgi:aspartate carbamoyltransferase catalytic subunit